MTWAAVTSLQPEQPWVPGLECPGAEEVGVYVAASEPPMILKCLVLSMGPQTRDPGRPSHSYCKPYSTPKLVDAPDLKSCESHPLFPISCWGIPALSFLPWSPSADLRQLPPVKHLSGVKIWLEDQEVRKRSSVTKAFGCFEQFASNLQARNPISFTKPLMAPETRG